MILRTARSNKLYIFFLYHTRSAGPNRLVQLRTKAKIIYISSLKPNPALLDTRSREKGLEHENRSNFSEHDEGIIEKLSREIELELK